MPLYRIVMAPPTCRWSRPGWVNQFGGPLMNRLGLPAPELTDDPRVTFWFTRRGWHEVGQHVLGEIRTWVRENNPYWAVVVKTRPTPLRSQIVYRDPLQVALLPRRDKRSAR